MEVKKDDLSYFSPLVTFQVEDTIFKVPRREFEEESEVFEDMYSLPSENAKEGESDEHPLRLEGVSVSDFRCFLQALIRRPALRSTKSLTEHDLEMALKLAKMWCFNGLQEVLIKDLEALGLPASRKLQLARLYDIKEWYKPELRKLALRRSSLTLEEAERLGLDLTVVLSILRDGKLETILEITVFTGTSGYTSGSRIMEDNKKEIESQIDAKLAKFSQEHNWDTKDNSSGEFSWSD